MFSAQKSPSVMNPDSRISLSKCWCSCFSDWCCSLFVAGWEVFLWETLLSEWCTSFVSLDLSRLLWVSGSASSSFHPFCAGLGLSSSLFINYDARRRRLRLVRHCACTRQCTTLFLFWNPFVHPDSSVIWIPKWTCWTLLPNQVQLRAASRVLY